MWTGLGFGKIKGDKMHCIGFEPMTVRSWDKPSTIKLGIRMIIFLHCFLFIQIYYMLHAS